MAVNEQTGNDYLKFTSDVWKPDSTTGSIGKTTVSRESHFPFLDMELFWNNDADLAFRVHVKPNQEIKYLTQEAPTPQTASEQFIRVYVTA